jgi:hypothetical protein
MEEQFYIWSIEHNAWWKPNRFGYTKKLFEAGKYSYREAVEICRDANYFLGEYPSGLCEVMVPTNGVPRGLLREMPKQQKQPQKLVLNEH